MRYKKIIILIVELSFFVWFFYRSWQLIAFGTLFILPVLLGYSLIKKKRKFVWQNFLEKYSFILRWFLILATLIFSRLFGEDFYRVSIFSTGVPEFESSRFGVGLFLFICSALTASFYIYLSLFWRDLKNAIKKNDPGFPPARE